MSSQLLDTPSSPLASGGDKMKRKSSRKYSFGKALQRRDTPTSEDVVTTIISPRSSKKQLAQIEKALKAADPESPYNLDYEKHCRVAEIRKDPHYNDILRFPKDDIDIVTVPKECRTETSTVPEGYEEMDLPFYVKDTLRFYEQPWKLVRRKYQNASETHRLVLPESSSYDKLLFEKHTPVMSVGLADSNFLCLKGVSDSQGSHMSLSSAKGDVTTSNTGTKNKKSMAPKETARGEQAKAGIHSDPLSDPPPLPRGTEALKRPKSTSLSKTDVPKSVDRNSASYAPLNGEIDSAQPDLLTGYSRTTDQENKEGRTKDRHNVFELFREADGSNRMAVEKGEVPSAETTSLVDHSTLTGDPAAFSPEPGTQFIVDVKKLKFNLGKFEPFFGFITLYDISKRKRISETFCFDTNSIALTALYRAHGDHGITKNTNTAIFNISRLSRAERKNIYMVLRIEKILQGDVDSVAEPYIGYEKMKDKDVDKFRSSVKEVCSRLGAYRQPFAWGMAPLFDELDQVVMGDLTIKQLFKQKSDMSDANLFATMGEMNKTGTGRRHKIVPGHCDLQLRPIKPNHPPPPGRIDSDLNAVPPLSKDTIVREMRELLVTPILRPHLTYCNTLYLYLEGLNLSNRGGGVSCRNLAVKIEFKLTDEPSARAEEVLFANDGSASLTDHMFTPVTYHTKTPQFYDELKIKLPVKLERSHHLLFTFYHVHVQPMKNKPTILDTVGFACLPILHNGRLLAKDHHLPVFTDLVSAYVTEMTTPEPAMKFVDNKKPLFKLRAKLNSTIYSQDSQLQQVLNEFHDPANPSLELSSSSGEMSNHLTSLKPIKGLYKVNPVRLVHHLPVIMNQIFRTLVSDKSHGQTSIKALAALLSAVSNNNIATSGAGDRLLLTYITHVFDSERICGKGKKAPKVHEELTSHWLEILRKSSDQNERLLFVQFSWFFLQIIFKSMSYTVEAAGDLKDDSTRAKRFPTDFVKSLRSLMIVLTWESQHRCSSGLNVARDTVRTLALFCHDLFAIMDRGVVFQIIHRMVNDVAPVRAGKKEDMTLVTFKFEFLTILFRYEHHVALNLPRNNVSVSITELLPVFRKRHFLSSMLLDQIHRYFAIEEKATRAKATASVRHILAEFDLDSRYTNKLVRQQITTAFFPYMIVVIDNLQALLKMTFVEKRAALISFMYVLKNCNPGLLRDWWCKETQGRVISFFDVLMVCVDVFEYVGRKRQKEQHQEAENQTITASNDTKSMLESFYQNVGKGFQGKGSNQRYRSLREKRTEMRMRDNKNASAQEIFAEASDAEMASIDEESSSDTLSDSDSPSLGSADSSSNDFKGDRKGGFTANVDDTLVRYLSNEISHVVLDVMEDFIEDHRHHLRQVAEKDPIMSKIFALQIKLLSTNQSQNFLTNMYSVMRAFLHKFSKPLFRSLTLHSSDLCPVVINHCNCPNPAIRATATAYLFTLMKINFTECPKNFSRIKVQLTIALSKLVAKGIKDDTFLRRSLGLVNQYAKDARGVGAGFSTLVDDLITRLFKVLRDSIKIAQYKNDPDMKADLYHAIAEGYNNTPDLRVAWLESLAQFHIKGEHPNWAESAQCNIHISALVAEYLHLKCPTPGLPKGCLAFTTCAFDADIEKALKDAVHEEGICESETFTERGLSRYIQISISDLENAELYETANELYKIQLAIHEKNRDWKELSAAHDDLASIFKKLTLACKANSRMMGSYYRVGLYGDLFQELNGMEYVYKEPKITRLMEIKGRLVKLWSDRFGAKRVIIVEDSNPVDTGKLKPQHAYIQLTSVHPYFEPEDFPRRPVDAAPSQHDLNFGACKFMFETPFTKSAGGKAHAKDVADQWKRKTILSTDGKFPNTRTRLKIKQKDEIEMSPIENSIEAISGRTELLKAELARVPLQAKTLQPVLQGSVLLQVNAGPQEIAKTFLGNADRYPKKILEELKTKLRQFLEACRLAVLMNKTLITPDQTEYANELEQGCDELVMALAPFIDDEASTANGSSSSGLLTARRRNNTGRNLLSVGSASTSSLSGAESDGSDSRGSVDGRD